MSRRLLLGGFVVVALWALVASEVGAKPPDLPADVKDVVEPTAAPETEAPRSTLPVPPPCAAEGMGLPLPAGALPPMPVGCCPALSSSTSMMPGALPPVAGSLTCPTSQNVTIRIELPTPQAPESESSFYRLPLADRKLMTSCALIGMHPLLSLVPANSVMYWPMETRETLGVDAWKNNSTVDIHYIGDKVLVTGRVHDVDEATEVMRIVRSKVPGEPNIINLLRVTDEQQVKSGVTVAQEQGAVGLLPAPVPPSSESEEKERAVWLSFRFKVDELIATPCALYLADIEAELTENSLRLSIPLFSPLAITVNVTGLQPLPAAKEKKCPWSGKSESHDTEEMAVQLEQLPTVLENLQHLEEAEHLFDQAREFLNTGRVAAALDLFEKIVRKCPGSRLDEMVQTVLFELFSKPAGAAEEAEQGTEEQDALPAFDGWGMLRRIVEPWWSSKDPLKGEKELVDNPEELRRMMDEFEQVWASDQPIRLTNLRIFSTSCPNSGVAGDPGARVMADGLLKAARLALETGDSPQAKALARQAYALDPVRMQEDPDVYSLYLLAIEPEMKGPRVNNFGPAGRD